MIVAGDVGGTKTLLGLFEPSDDGPRCLREVSIPSAEDAEFAEAVASFLRDAGSPEIEAGCFGIAGPVIDGRVYTTNLPWEVDEASLAEVCGAKRVELLNDLQAASLGMLVVDDFAVLHGGRDADRPGTIAVVAPGTGLGVGILYWDGDRHHAIATEGGHVDFAPRDERQIALLRWLQRRHGGRVSTERVLSGPGFADLYQFLLEESGSDESSEVAAARERGDDVSAAVAEAGLAGRDDVCARTLALFASVLGAETGNAVLRVMATGGAFLGGGIPPKILPALQTDAFREAYLDKGRFRGLLQHVPVSVCLEPRAALYGAAQRALSLR